MRIDVGNYLDLGRYPSVGSGPVRNVLVAVVEEIAQAQAEFIEKRHMGNFVSIAPPITPL